MKPYYKVLRVGYGREPKVQHATLKEAENESLRLAGQHPGETFEILQCLGITRTTKPSTFWCDGASPEPGLLEGPEPGLLEGPGDGYRFLEAGELVREGDEFYQIFTDCWVPTTYKTASRYTARSCDVGIYRRKVGPDIADPGPGFRLLDDGEVVESGDQFFHSKGWHVRGGTQARSFDSNLYRPVRRAYCPQP